MASLGMGYEEVNAMPLPFVLNELLPYFADNPPVHILLRDFIGYRRTVANASEYAEAKAKVETAFLATMPVKPHASIPDDIRELMARTKAQKVN